MNRNAYYVTIQQQSRENIKRHTMIPDMLERSEIGVSRFLNYVRLLHTATSLGPKHSTETYDLPVRKGS